MLCGINIHTQCAIPHDNYYMKCSHTRNEFDKLYTPLWKWENHYLIIQGYLASVVDIADVFAVAKVHANV